MYNDTAGSEPSYKLGCYHGNQLRKFDLEYNSIPKGYNSIEILSPKLHFGIQNMTSFTDLIIIKDIINYISMER